MKIWPIKSRAIPSGQEKFKIRNATWFKIQNGRDKKTRKFIRMEKKQHEKDSRLREDDDITAER